MIFFSYFVSHSWGIPMMKITDLSHLFKLENLHNWWLTKYFFAPLYIFNLLIIIVRIPLYAHGDREKLKLFHWTIKQISMCFMTEQKFKGKHKTSWVTRITLVLWIGNETLHKLSCFGNASRYADCLKPIYNLIHWLMARTRHLLLRFLCRKRTCRQRKELGSKRSVSFPIQWTRVTRVTRDVLFHRFHSTLHKLSRFGNDVPNTPS